MAIAVHIGGNDAVSRHGPRLSRRESGDEQAQHERQEKHADSLHMKYPPIVNTD